MLRFYAALLALAMAPAAGAATAAAPQEAAVCDWSKPGSNRYTGSTDAALARLAKHFTPAQAAELRRMVATAGGHSDQVLITRHAISGRLAYHPTITYMHFGAGHVCRSVVRQRLAAPVGALVYMPKGASRGLLRPASCDNWALVHKAQPMRDLAGDDGGPGPLALATAQPRADGADAAAAILAMPPSGGDGAPGTAEARQAPERMGSLLAGPSFATAAAGTSAAPDSGSGSAAPVLAGASGAQLLDGLATPLPFAPAPPVISLPAPLPGVPEPRAGLLLALGLALVATTPHLAKGKA